MEEACVKSVICPSSTVRQVQNVKESSSLNDWVQVKTSRGGGLRTAVEGSS